VYENVMHKTVSKKGGKEEANNGITNKARKETENKFH
jgi:hypothetical protein